MGSSPNWSYGFVPSAAQWNAAFAGKQDELGFVPLNANGGSMGGPLIAFGSTPENAGLTISPGSAPNVPQDGDIWVDGTGLYVCIAGQTVGPLNTGTGDVTGPSSATDGNFAAFNGASGGVIEDSGVDASSFATALQGALAASALQPSDIDVSVQAHSGNLDTLALNGSGATGLALLLAASPQAARQSIVADTLPGHLYGLALANNATDAVNDIDVAIGSAADSTGLVRMVLSTAITKQLDAAWAVGTNKGGRMSAAALANTTYHVFLIYRSDTGVVDVGFDVSPTAPSLPANYTNFRRIGSIIRSGGTILAFTQIGDDFFLMTWANDVTAANPGTSRVLRALTVPLGISVTAILSVGAVADGTVTGSSRGMIFSPYESDPPLSNDYNIGTSVIVSNGNPQSWSFLTVRTDTSCNIASKMSASATNVQLIIVTRGWIDARGRLG